MTLDNNSFIGQIRVARFKYFNHTKNKLDFKSRPILIIGVERDTGPCDFTILPISSILRQENIIPYYDIKLDKVIYPGLNLQSDCYCRSSKVSTVHSGEVSAKLISSVSLAYPDLYNTIQERFNSFTSELF